MAQSPRVPRHSRVMDAVTPDESWRAGAPPAAPRWRGLYVVEADPRDVDDVLAMRGTKWHAEARFLAAFAQGMRRLL